MDQVFADYNPATAATTVANHRQYGAFGAITAESDPSVEFLYAYTGRDWDEDAQLSYHRARWYDPSTRQWLSEDPISFAAGDANLSRYVGNDPANASGLRPDPEDYEARYRWYLNRAEGHRMKYVALAGAINERLSKNPQTDIGDLIAKADNAAGNFWANLRGALFLLAHGKVSDPAPYYAQQYACMPREADPVFDDNRRKLGLRIDSKRRAWDTAYTVLYYADNGVTIISMGTAVGGW